jgi:hypothetical protein
MVELRILNTRRSAYQQLGFMPDSEWIPRNLVVRKLIIEVIDDNIPWVHLAKESM